MPEEKVYLELSENYKHTAKIRAIAVLNGIYISAVL